MYPLTIGFGDREPRTLGAGAGLPGRLPFRIIVEHQDLGDLSNFLDRLERMRPDVVLVDISDWKEPLEGLVTSIRAATGDPMIDRPEQHRGRRSVDPVLACAPASTNISFRRATSRCGRRSKSAPRSAAGGATAGAKGAARLRLSFRQGRMRRHHAGLPRGRGTGPAEPESAAGGSRPGCRHGRLHHQDQVGLLDSGRGQQPAPPGHLVLEGAGLQRHSGRGDRRLAAGAGFQAAAQGRADAPGAGLRQAALRLDRWWTWAAA